MNGVIPIMNKYSGCCYHRIYLPYKYLGVDFKSLEGKKFDDLAKDTKVLVYNRTPKQALLPYELYRKQYGFKILVDLDDYWQLYPKHELSAIWRKQKMESQIVESLKIADAVTVTTSLLADKVKQFNKNVYVVPNGLPFGDLQFHDKKHESDKLRFMWAGGSSHLFDMKQLEAPLQKVNNNPLFDNSKFILAGIPQNPDNNWVKIENTFSLNKKLKNYFKIHARTLDSYMDVYTEADVCIIPLENNRFNANKSNLKIVEAGCKYNPVICTDTSPYADEPNRDLIMYANNAREWYEHMKYCVENPSFVKERGQELGEYVREHYDVRKINETRKQIIEHLSS